jgi:pilus assembly protein TadC
MDKVSDLKRLKIYEYILGKGYSSFVLIIFLLFVLLGFNWMGISGKDTKEGQ